MVVFLQTSFDTLQPVEMHSPSTSEPMNDPVGEKGEKEQEQEQEQDK